MENQTETKAISSRKPPYVSITVFDSFLGKIQKINPPAEPISINTFKTWAIADKQEPSLISTLKFLGAIDNKGYPTEKFTKLQSTGDTFREELTEILREAYPDFFSLYKDPAKLNKEEVVAFFQKSSNASKEKMAAFFAYLCGLANMGISGFQKSTISNGQSTTGKKVTRQPIQRKSSKEVSGSEILQLAETMKDWDADKVKSFFEGIRTSYKKTAEEH